MCFEPCIVFPCFCSPHPAVERLLSRSPQHGGRSHQLACALLISGEPATTLRELDPDVLRTRCQHVCDLTFCRNFPIDLICFSLCHPNHSCVTTPTTLPVLPDSCEIYQSHMFSRTRCESLQCGHNDQSKCFDHSFSATLSTVAGSVSRAT